MSDERQITHYFGDSCPGGHLEKPVETGDPEGDALEAALKAKLEDRKVLRDRMATTLAAAQRNDKDVLDLETRLMVHRKALRRK